jgi:hypothetical protein
VSDAGCGAESDPLTQYFFSAANCFSASRAGIGVQTPASFVARIAFFRTPDDEVR